MSYKEPKDLRMDKWSAELKACAHELELALIDISNHDQMRRVVEEVVVRLRVTAEISEAETEKELEEKARVIAQKYFDESIRIWSKAHPDGRKVKIPWWQRLYWWAVNKIAGALED